MADLRNRKNVFTGGPDVLVSGGALIGNPVTDSAQIPTDATGELNEALGMKPIGFIGQDGVTKTVNRTVEKVKDWNGDTVVTIQSEHDVTLKFQVLETGNEDVLKALNGDANVTSSGGKLVIKDNAEELPYRSYAFHIRGNEGAKILLFVPNGKITNIGDVVYSKSDVIRYEVEIECFADSDNVKMYQFIDRPGDSDESEADDTDEPEAPKTKTVTLPSGVTGGMWSLTVNGKTASNLAHNAAASVIQQKLTDAGVSGVTVTGNAGGPYTVSGATSVVANGASLTGGESTTINVA